MWELNFENCPCDSLEGGAISEKVPGTRGLHLP